MAFQPAYCTSAVALVQQAPAAQRLGKALAEPTEKATSVLFSNSTGSTHIEWVGGNGLFSLVLMREGGPVDAAPVDGVLYAADSTFGDGDEIGASSYVVAVTNANACWVYGLTESQEYHIAVFEGSGLGTCADYLGDPQRDDMTFTLVVLFSFDLVVQGDGVQVCWETASEVLTLGFWVQRRNEDGTWTTIHPYLIPAQGFFNGGVGARYGVQNVYGPFGRTAYALQLESPIRVVPGGVAIHWLSRSNESYRVFRSEDLTGAFLPIATGVLATPPENVYTDAAGRIGFYLISVEPPE